MIESYEEINMMKVDLKWIIGSGVESVTYDEQAFRWLFTIDAQISLVVTCPWQILAEDCVALASGDHDQQYGQPAPIDAAAKATALLATRKIVRACPDQLTADLTIELEGEVVLRTFNDSSGFEAWHLVGAQGEQFIAQGGGNIVTFAEKDKV